MLKILYHHRIKSRDGQYIHIRSMIEAFRRMGHQVDEVGLTAGEAESLQEESRFWETFSRIVPHFLVEILEYIYSLPAALWLWARVLKNSPDLIYERYALGNFAGVLAAKWAGIPLFLEVNSPLAQEKLATGHLKFPRLAKLSEKQILKNATKVIVVSQVMKDIYGDQGLDPDHLNVIPNGIVPEHYENRSGHGIREQYGVKDSILIGFVGFFRRWHRLDCVLKLLAGPLKDKDVKLMLTGDGPAREELEKEAHDLNLKDRVIFTGILSHHQIPDLLDALDIALQSEVTAYASPMKLFEYMAAGKAVVAPCKDNILEIVEHEKTALLFPPNEPEKMGEALQRLALDPKLRQCLGENAKRAIKEREYTWDANVNRVMTMYEKL